MANIIDLGALENAEYMRRFQLLQSFMRAPGAGGKSELEKVLDEQEALDLKKQAQDRLLQESQARQAEAQASQRLKEAEFGIKQQQEQRAEQAFPLYQQKTSAEIDEIRKRADLTVAQKEQAIAAALAERARAGQETEQTNAIRLYESQSRDNVARSALAVGYGNALTRLTAPGPHTADEVKNATNWMRSWTRDPTATFPTNPDGSLDTNRATPSWIVSQIPKEANIDIPTAFSANKPANTLQENLAGLNRAIQNGDTGSINAYGDAIVKDNAMNPDQIEGSLLHSMLVQGDPNALDFVSRWAQAKKGGEVLKEPPEAAGKDMQLGMDLLSNIDAVTKMQAELGSRMPAGGWGSTTMQKLDTVLGTSDPGVQAFQSAVGDLSTKYNRLAAGVATGKMGEELKEGIYDPYKDTPASLAAKLPIMRTNVMNSIRTNMGYLQAQGYRIPDVSQLGPDFQPISPTEAMARWGKPEPTMPGYSRFSSGLDAEAQNRSMAESIRRAGTLAFGRGGGLAGPNQFRGQTSTPSVSAPTKEQVAVFRTMIKNPKALELFDKYFPTMSPEQQWNVIKNKAGIE